jgi:Arc/MetJ-type ribon-helix-helix transcriptional regulator
MKKVSISLTEEHAAFIEAEVAAGDFASISDVIAAALHEFFERPANGPSEEQMLADIDAAEAELAAGGELLDAEAVHQRLRAIAQRMRPRRPRVLPAAHRDLERRTRLLRRERGGDFAEDYVQNLIGWVARLADTGGQFGTEVAGRPGRRSFGYRGQATIIVRFYRRRDDRRAHLLPRAGLVARALMLSA